MIKKTREEIEELMEGFPLYEWFYFLPAIKANLGAGSSVISTTFPMSVNPLCSNASKACLALYLASTYILGSQSVYPPPTKTCAFDKWSNKSIARKSDSP